MSYVVIYKVAQGPFEIMVVTKNPWIGHYLGHLMACLPHVKIMVSRLSTILNHKFVELVAILGH